ncbi:MAG: ribosomal RNA small subunit methyltransferase A [Clostridia bacterium]|nr:ribosomal RNA small subunit methyltransferase A [Clostridia bacterium]
MSIYDTAYLKGLAERFGFTFEKSFGQNFLTDTAAVERIVEASGALGADVFEIGPGAGALTLGLSRVARSVRVLELDRRLEPVLKETLPPSVELTWGDILTFPLDSLPKSDRRVAVSNLPYNVTTKALTRLFESGMFSRITVTVQKEYARKLVQKENRSLIALLAEHYAEPKYLFTIPAGSFYPRPGVDSAVVTMALKPLDPDKESEAMFIRTAHALYASRRKTVRNTLSAEFGASAADAALKSAEVDPAARGEDLSAREVERISSALMLK